jgi:glycosyltransferase involved in cell wall biosynthesis
MDHDERDPAPRLRIALVAPPVVPVPPPGYAGTERVVAALGGELARRGHEVTLFASGDSELDITLVPTVDRALWQHAGAELDTSAWMLLTTAIVQRHLDRFDIVHAHLETYGFALARASRVPVVSTLHLRLDAAGVPDLLAEYREIPLVAISESQRRWSPEANWVDTIPHGLPFADAPVSDEPGDYLALVGRVSTQKGVAEAVGLARTAGMPLRMAAKVLEPAEQALFRDVVRPAIDEGVVEFLGEVDGAERDKLLAGAYATLMLGAWPEPFGLVAIESLAIGTPVIGRRAGALPEIVEHARDGFLVDDLTEAAYALTRIPTLDRASIRARARARFSVGRMTDRYERVYRSLIAEDRRGSGREAATRAPWERPSRRVDVMTRPGTAEAAARG